MLRLVSYIKNPIDYAVNGREYILVDGLGPLKAALKGRGVIYSWFQGVGRTASLNCQFELQQTTPAENFTDESGKIHLGVEARVPCSGLVTSTGEGFLICPAYKLEPIKGQSISFLLLEPRNLPYSMAVEKTVLSIPTEESELTITSDDGEIHCTGTISSRSRTAHIILNRNPELPVYRAGFNQTLSQLNGRGQIQATWKPTIRAFEETLVAFYPSSMASFGTGMGFGSGMGYNPPLTLSLDTIASGALGAPEVADPGEFDDYVIGEGAGIDYRLRLTIDRGLGRHISDETKLSLV